MVETATAFAGDTGDQTSGMAAGYMAAAERIEIEVGPQSGMCLDVGCNTGVGMLTLGERWPESCWFGIEPSPKQAAIARAMGCEVAICTAESMWHPAGRFDFVFARHSFEHCRDRAKAIEQIRRVLKSGGLLYVQAPIESNGTKNVLHLSPFGSHEELRAAFGLHASHSAPLIDPWIERYWGPQETVAELILEKC